MTHGRHIYAKAYDIEKYTMCSYPQSYHALPHWKFVLQVCADYPCINLPVQETDNHYSETTPSIWFHIYHIIARCSAHDRIPLKYKKICHMCKQKSSSDESTKIYTIKELVMTETNISGFHTSLYISAIQKLPINLPYVHILGTKHCGEIQRTSFKRRELFQDVLFHRDFSESLVTSFSHQIQSKYMVEIYQCLLRVLHWNILVRYH